MCRFYSSAEATNENLLASNKTKAVLKAPASVQIPVLLAPIALLSFLPTEAGCTVSRSTPAANRHSRVSRRHNHGTHDQSDSPYHHPTTAAKTVRRAVTLACTMLANTNASGADKIVATASAPSAKQTVASTRPTRGSGRATTNMASSRRISSERRDPAPPLVAVLWSAYCYGRNRRLPVPGRSNMRFIVRSVSPAGADRFGLARCRSAS